MCWTAQQSAPSRRISRMYSTRCSNARPAVRTRSTGVISRSNERIGLIFMVMPSHACALPMRPPRCRYSKVSMQNRIFTARRASRTRAATSFNSAPERADAAAASSRQPSPPAPVSPSITSMRSPRPRSASTPRACRAAS
jgi:hypothetical protein